MAKVVIPKNIIRGVGSHKILKGLERKKSVLVIGGNQIKKKSEYFNSFSCECI